MFVVLESKKLKPAQGFEHVKGYGEFSAGKPRGCSGYVYTVYTGYPPVVKHG